ncbi:MAG: lipid-A-disaccharide synthase [Rhodobacteraceae bacterium TMED160]|nr:MAG: lipid-A-disaccharide synthase [Rhodobacteraceae bacterium TMED160]
MKIFIIAGEDSGDKLGSAIIDGLREVTDVPPKFVGIGGNGMISRGLESIFPMSELSVMGFVEIASKYKSLKKRLNQTISSILDEKPDILLTIDAPEFCFRVAKKVKLLNKNIAVAHYVAPTVWAWRSNRAKQISNFIDQILALFPFEPRYFHDVGVRCDFVGHPIVSETLADEESVTEFKKAYSLTDEPVILCLPGSRKSEIDRLMPVFGETLEKFSNALPNARFILPSTPDVYEYSKKFLDCMPKDIIFLTPEKFGVEKYLEFKKASFKLSQLALAASGTVSLELAANNTPMVIGYDMNFLSRKIIGLMLKIDTVNLVNLVTGNRNIPECIGSNFNSEKLFLEMVRVYSNNLNQIKDFKTTMDLLGINKEPPNVRAANSLLNLFENFKTV